MTTTLETQTTYKGWTNYETWNVAEWIMNTEDLYDIASLCDDYQDMVDSIENFITKTPDGVSFTSDNLDTQALDNLIDTINLVTRKIQQLSESY